MLVRGTGLRGGRGHVTAFDGAGAGAPGVPSIWARATATNVEPAAAATAALPGGAAVIHLVMVPSHWGESVVEGAGFAVAGWLQLVLAIAFVRSWRRGAAWLAAASSVALIAAWAVSRTAGFPFGAHAGHPEEVGFVDLVCVAMEAVVVVLAAASLRWPSPSARNHAAQSHGEHAAGAAATAGAHAHTHTASTAAVDDKGLAALSNGHHDHIGAEEPLDRATRIELARQIAVTQEVARQYSTVAAAMAAGYRRAGPYSPGLGAHFTRPTEPALNADGVMDDEDLRSPLGLIYAGTDPDAPMAGFMYYSMSATKPVGFAGANDHWHFHTNTCIQGAADGGIDAPFGADRDVTDAQCARAGGTLLHQTQWMVHVWSVPGWESQQGLFGEVNPGLACPDGTYHQIPVDQFPDHPMSTCVSAG